MLHLTKLCVGISEPAELRSWQAERQRGGKRLVHLTRHMPRRAAEITGGGSIYWVIGRAMLLRQRVTGLEPDTRMDGTPCTAIVLDPALVAVHARPMKAFQGWRYLNADDAPPDLQAGGTDDTLPYALAKELRDLCLL